jgi:hypothetical protein
MVGSAIGVAREVLREFFFLEQAERTSAASTVSQLDSVRAYEEAARRRLSAARALRDPTEHRVALSLYRSAALLQIAALLASRDPTLQVEQLTPEGLLERLGGAVEGATREVESLRSVLTASDPFGVERLPTEATLRAVASATARLSTLIELRSPTHLCWISRIRLAGAALAVLLMTVWFARWVLLPPNVALHKPARASSTNINTQPAGVVDGETNGQFGYHSQQEDQPWVSIDLERPYNLKMVNVVGRGDGWYDQSIPLVLEVSDDGKAYRPVARRTIPFSEDAPWTIDLDGVKAQFVRLRADHYGYLVLGEVAVYGVPSTK